MAENSTLLSIKEQTACKTLSAQKTLDGKRAKALLALHDGDIQAVAAKKSGLSFGQVKYLLTVFRKKRLSVFSEIKSTEKKQEPVQKTKVQKPNSKETKKVPKGAGKKKEKKEKKKKLKKKNKKDKDKKSKKKKSKKSKKK